MPGSFGTVTPKTPEVFPPKGRHRRYDDSKLFFEMSSYSSATPGIPEAQSEDEEAPGMMKLSTECGEGTRRRHASYSLSGAVQKGRGVYTSWRIIHEGTHGARVNHEFPSRDISRDRRQMTLGGAVHLAGLRCSSMPRTRGGRQGGPSTASSTTRTTGVFLGCRSGSFDDEVWLNSVGTSEVSSAGYRWSGPASEIHRGSLKVVGTAWIWLTPPR